MHTASHSYQQLHTLIMRGPHFACSLCLYTRAKIMCDSSAVTAVERAVAARTPSAAARSQRRRRASARACRPAAARSVAQQRCCLPSHPRSKKDRERWRHSRRPLTAVARTLASVSSCIFRGLQTQRRQPLSVAVRKLFAAVLWRSIYVGWAASGVPPSARAPAAWTSPPARLAARGGGAGSSTRSGRACRASSRAAVDADAVAAVGSMLCVLAQRTAEIAGARARRRARLRRRQG